MENISKQFMSKFDNQDHKHGVCFRNFLRRILFLKDVLLGICKNLQTFNLHKE